jgi:hypothetical protein
MRPTNMWAPCTHRTRGGADRTSYVDMRKLDAAFTRSAGAAPARIAARQKASADAWRRSNPRGRFVMPRDAALRKTGRCSLSRARRGVHSHGTGAKAEHEATSAAPETSASLVIVVCECRGVRVPA